jgi:deferrochelatase/peroxidase EfeB
VRRVARTRSCRPITTLYAHREEPNEENGEEQLIFRRNTAFETPSEHGTLFVGFSADQYRLARMLNWMAEAEGAPVTHSLTTQLR